MYRFLIVLLFLFSAFEVYAETYEVKSGDTLYGILSDRFTPQEMSEINAQIKKEYKGFILRPGMKLTLVPNKVTLNAALDKDIIIERMFDGSTQVRINEYQYDMMNVLVRGTIETNLFDAMYKAGEDAELAANLASIFEWEIDFFKDLRPGDKFIVLVEKKFIKNKYAGYGKIVAADFYNQGKLKRAVYYNDGGKNKGYYNEKGEGLERGFLRVPLNYSRISSRYSTSRLHPVLGYHRPHYGVDYAAPTGTPVKATASGIVKIKSRSKGNGNYIALRHPNGYETFYLHLNGFNRAIKQGSHVEQGQIIGYVGSTGYSTGPHLDYRIRKNGRWLNPLKFVATPKTLKKDDVAAFLEFASSYFDKLDMSHIMYAQNSPLYTVPPVSSMAVMQF